nr:MAG TPA: hypothetical protein [Caudoviricetes sp.]
MEVNLLTCRCSGKLVCIQAPIKIRDMHSINKQKSPIHLGRG